ncbi:Metallo-beta-lactamase superfamily protein [compost metagenome]
MGASDFFTIKKAAEGIWAAIVVPGSGALGNAAILDLGNQTVVVDTFMLPQAGEYLRETAEELTGRTPGYVVNTHFHGDHHYGNQAFPGSTVISTQLTKELLQGYGVPSVEVWQTALRNQITGFTETKTKQTDRRIRAALEAEIADKEQLFLAVPSITRVTANLTFTDRLTIHGSARTAQVITFGGGHTKSDAFVYVPEEKVLVAGDLVLGTTHPAMLNGDEASWLRILERMENELAIGCLIPGHGQITGADSITEMRNYLQDIQVYARKAAASGQSVEHWLDRGIPEPYDGWEGSHVFEWNLRWLFDRYLKENKE